VGSVGCGRATEFGSLILPFRSRGVRGGRSEHRRRRAAKIRAAAQWVGEVFGIKFRPGMFRQLSRTPAHRLCREAWGGAFTFRVLGCGSVDERIANAEAALREICPVSIWDPRAILARYLVERVSTKPDLRSVSILAEVSDLSERALQRLFRDYVGVSPKWVVRRFRLQEAAELLATTQQSVASVAADLGYFDQSHFVRDFKAAVGEAPLNFLRNTNPLRG
jgi:AraC-like DNA-binding protein